MIIQFAVRALVRPDRRSRISSRNWSGGTKNGFSCSTPPMITTGCVRMMSMTTVELNFDRSYAQITGSSYLGDT